MYSISFLSRLAQIALSTSAKRDEQPRNVELSHTGEIFVPKLESDW